MSENKNYAEPMNSTSVNNADRLYNSLSDSNKALITAMLNTAFVLLKSVQSVQHSTNNSTTTAYQ